VNAQEGAPLAADAAAQDRISRDDPIVSERRCSPGRMSGKHVLPDAETLDALQEFGYLDATREE
jgi:hypothetical protein